MKNITVYAIAWGGKFIGSGQDGLAKLTVSGPDGKVLPGLKDVPITEGNIPKGDDGSGVTANIMQSVPWGTPVDKTDAYSYSFAYNPPTPQRLTFTVDVYHNGVLMATASNQQVVWAGLNLTGVKSIVVVLPGLLTNVVEPKDPLVFYYQQPGTISVNVYMMCGCKIDNNFWPGDNFYVQAVFSNASGVVAAQKLNWSGLATFSGDWPPHVLGDITIQSFVVETTNGNTACSLPVATKVLPA